MLFNSLTFFIFFPVFLALYLALHGRGRLWLIVLGSFLFYGWWDWRFLALLMFSIVVDYNLGLAMERRTDERARKRLITLSVVINLGFLSIFKYANFFIGSFQGACGQLGWHPDLPVLHVILPVGISFYTFQSMSYTIEVYRKHIAAEKSFLRFSAFVAFFPVLVAGPIVKALDMLPQMQSDRRVDWDEVVAGVQQMIWGFFKKVAIADSLALVVDTRFSVAAASQPPISLAIGVLFYTFQIYCDFSGYSDIAIGVARILGFRIPPNFRHPYFSASFSEFWTRWHISLSTWLRDYLYIPLGGNRQGTAKTYRNLLLTMLLGGLWHGASWNFVIWGGLHGSYLVIQRLLAPGYQRAVKALRVPALISESFLVALVFLLTCFAWIFFRAATFGQALAIIKSIAAVRAFHADQVENLFLVAKGCGLIGILLIVEFVAENAKQARGLLESPWLRAAGSCAALWLIALNGTFAGSSFIYFQF